MMRGEALRYLGWQVWDRAGPRLLACVVITLAVCLPLHFAIEDRPPSPAELTRMLHQMHTQFGFVFALLFAHGIIAQDRVQGWYRFYLSKPVAPAWFYGQAIGLAWVGMAASSAAFVIVFSLALRPAWAWSVVGEGLVIFSLVGMLVVFWSSLTKHDWVMTILVLTAVGIIRNVVFPRNEPPMGDVAHALLPPTHLMAFEDSLTAGQWAWVLGWAAGLCVLTLWIITRRPLGED